MDGHAVRGALTPLRYVSLATDSAPTYAVWAPVAARLWRRLGYQTILAISADEGWNEPAGQVILNELRDLPVSIVPVPRIGQLTVANTMRCARLVAASREFLAPDDFILTADVDMMPFSRTFFDLYPGDAFIVLRALYQAWLGNGGDIPEINDVKLRPGEFRLPMCYCGATVGIWRELIPEIVASDIEESLIRLVGAVSDAIDLDEALLSFRILSSPRAQGWLELLDPAGVWRKRELILVDPITLPLLSVYPDMPRGLLRLDDFWHPSLGLPAPPEAIDYIPHRFSPGCQPFGCFEVVAAYVPEARAWLDAYRAKLEAVL